MEQPAIALYRILGNELPPRHERGQVCRNLRFILEHEPCFPNCLKKWVVNRIVYSGLEKEIIALLERYRQPYIHIPFDLREYKRCGGKSIDDEGMGRRLSSKTDRERHDKILYVANINKARNMALEDGRKIADWILPFDGNSCFTQDGWDAMVRTLASQTTVDGWFAVSMYRLLDNRHYFRFSPCEYEEHEPQFVFGRKCAFVFDETRRYGDMDKSELSLRAGVACKDRGYGLIVLDPAHRCGYVVRLFSGIERAEGKWYDRAPLREKALDILLDKLDRCRSQGAVDRLFDIEYKRDAFISPIRFLLRPLRRSAERFVGLLKRGIKLKGYEERRTDKQNS